MNKVMGWVGKFFGFIVIPGLLGAFGMIGLLRVEQTAFFEQVSTALVAFERASWIVQISLAVVFVPGVLIPFRSARRLLPLLKADEDNEGLDEKFERFLGLSMVINGIYTVLNFLLFTIAAFPDNDLLLVSMGLFIVSIVFTVSLEISSVRLYQKKDPAKRGDPTSTKFVSQWFDSCDEAEKLMIYQSAHQSFQWTNLGFLVATLVVLLFRLAFGSFGLETILVIGGLWFVHLLGYHLKWMKLKKVSVRLE